MTVAELIELLQGLEPDRRVVVRGYDDGVDDVRRVEPHELILNYYSQWYYGAHQYVDGYAPDSENRERALAYELVGGGS